MSFLVSSSFLMLFVFFPTDAEARGRRGLLERVKPHHPTHLFQKNRFVKSYEEISSYLKENYPHIKTAKAFGEWLRKERAEGRHFWIPVNPQSAYKKRGWRGWRHFLGRPHFKSYEEIASYMRKYHPEIKTRSMFIVWIEGKHAEGKLLWIPKAPERKFLGKGWKDWYSFLGKERFDKTTGRKKSVFRSYEEVSSYLRENYSHIKTIKAFGEWLRKEHAEGRHFWIPLSPRFAYEGKGWRGWGHFLGRPHFKSYEEIVSYMRKYHPEIKYVRMFHEWIQKKHAEGELLWVPRSPDQYYKGKGWISWFHFLGKSKFSGVTRGGGSTVRPYKEVSSHIRKHHPEIKTKEDFLKLLREERKKGNFFWVPMNPEFVYRGKGWISWSHFFRKRK